MTFVSFVDYPRFVQRFPSGARRAPRPRAARAPTRDDDPNRRSRPCDYGARRTGVVVKYAAETESASALGAPVHVIRNGIASRAAGEADSFPCSSRAGARRRFIIGTAARLSPDKRLEDLLDAFRLALPGMPRCELRIAGGVERGAESYARELRRRARGLPVKWSGELPDTAAFSPGSRTRSKNALVSAQPRGRMCGRISRSKK